jgi:caffeoyl-CoA O-methyltransferase
MFRDRTDYIRKLFAPETPGMAAARGDGDISIYPEEGKLLQVLIRLGDIRRVVEIGTLSGYSALWMAGAGAEVVTIEKDPARAGAARKNLAGAAGVRLVEGDALSVLPSLEKEGPFDMAFIDADKLHYLQYLDWAEKNVRRGGLIVGDNTFLFDAAWKDGDIPRVRETARAAVREFNRRLADPEKYAGILLDTPEGITVGVKLF